jgi:glycosyltransferase involved in cell wall biosynthesis
MTCTKTNDTHWGLGASINNALAVAFKLTDVVLTTEDDWYLQSDFDISEYVHLIETDTSVGTIRLGAANYLVKYMSEYGTGLCLEVDLKKYKADVEKVGRANSLQVALRHKRMFDEVGLYTENKHPDIVEGDMNRRFVANGKLKILWPSNFRTYALVCKENPFIHFGESTVGHKWAITVPERKRHTYIGLASYKARESGMLKVVSALAPQCDRMFVSLNGYSDDEVAEIRAIANKNNVVFTGYRGNEDLGCQNKFRGVDNCEPGDYFLTVDDDLIYPADYVETMKKHCDKFDGSAILSCHGRTLPLDENGRYVIEKMSKDLYHYVGFVKDYAKVHVASGGAIVMVPSIVGVTFDRFKFPKNTGDDEILAVFAKENHIPMYVVPHKSGWLSYNHALSENGLYQNKEGAIKRREWLRDVGGIWKDVDDADNRPFFSVVVPVYRSCSTLRRALESIAKQTFKSYKVYVCDDESGEPYASNNEKSVNDILGSRGVFIRAGKKVFAGGARNIAMEHGSNSEYTLFLDADDLFNDNKLFNDIHASLIKNKMPDVMILPGFTEQTSKSTLKWALECVSPETLSKYRCFVTPWTKCVKTSICPQFAAGLRRSNDVLQHFRLVDRVKTVAHFNRIVVMHKKDGETTMFGDAASKNLKDPASVSSVLKCIASLLDTTYEHDYMRETIAREVRDELIMVDNILKKLGPVCLKNIISINSQLEPFSDELKMTKANQEAKRLGNRFIKNPMTIQEKIAHQMIFGITKLMTKCADKLGVREYAKSVLGKDICVQVLKVYGSPSEIKFSELPDKFVLKCNHGYHFNIVVRDKNEITEAEAKKNLEEWLKIDFSDCHGQLQYKNISRKCFAEEYIGGLDDTVDYKFCCFNGVPKFCQVIAGRDTENQHLNFYDMDFKRVNISQTNGLRARPDIIDEKPGSFELMKEYAKKLAEPFDYVRVDFYDLDGRPYLGELTFSPAATTQKYVDNDKTSLMLGSMLKLSR